METCIASALPLAQAQQLNAQFAAAAQRVYDEWDESNIDVYAGGGICHLIADALFAVCDENGIEASTVSSTQEQHVYVICRLANGVYALDIPYHLYEVGSMFSWKKIHDVQFTADFITWFCVDGNPANYEQYIDEC